MKNFPNLAKEINFQEVQEAQRVPKNLDSRKHTPRYIIIASPKFKDEEKEIENLFEKIMKENFPNLAKEIEFQEVQEAQRVPKKFDSRRNTPRHIITTLAKIKDKVRILKAAREKETVTYKAVPIRLS